MATDKVYTAIGMMSGTSLDGIDVALVRTDGMDFCELEAFECFEYSVETREIVQKAFGSTEPNAVTHAAEQEITKTHIQAIKAFGQDADIIGFHGQTILHDPARKISWQIGDPGQIAIETGIDVIGDMRQADIQAGGQGAPLLPLCHRAFSQHIEKPIAILNLGGVGNITFLGKERRDILAFDTGPANALMDDFIKSKTDKSYDLDGTLASAGRIDKTLLQKWLTNSYFETKPPKSLDRDEWNVSEIQNMNLEDAIATLAMFTVLSVQKAFNFLPLSPRTLYVAGGGRKNRFIMQKMNELFSFPVQLVEDIGWNGDALEAQGFGYLAVRSLKGLALTLPTTTGISEPMSGGVLYKSRITNAKTA
ncbi:MAG: anhydro-N-acetylmuramic acid kinase [Pseudomonadota bacterium]